MRDTMAWSIGLGRWLGVPVRLHVSFVLLLVAVMFVSERPPFDMGQPPLDRLWEYGLLLLGIWLASVILHAAGHLAVVSRLRVITEEVILTPVGELAEPVYRLDPQREVLAALSGPMANLAAWFSLGAILYALGEQGIAGLLNPFYPRELVSGAPAIVALKMGMWINGNLVLVNLLPALPLDGGRVLHSALASGIGSRRATMVVVRATLITAIVLVILALLLDPAPARVLVPAWVPLVMLSLYLFFHARLALYGPEDGEGEEELFGYDFSQGYTSLEQRVDSPRSPRPGLLRRWLDRRREQQEARRAVVEQEEEQRVDAILQQLLERGIDSLPADDRALLDRVSARYRARSQSEST